MKRVLLLFACVITICLTAGCQTETTDQATETPVGLPNPASVFCEQHGHTLQMRENAAGTAGYCQFADGSACEEWAFFRGECWPESLHWGPEVIEIVLLESFPIQVQAILTGQLPNSCSAVSEVTTVYDEASQTFTLTLVLAANGEIECDPAGLPFTETVSLDVVGLPAGTYTVSANDAAATFTFSVDNVAADEGAAANDVVAPIVSIDMSGWLVFVNYDYGFSFLYPPDWQVRQEQGPNHTLAGHLLYVEPTYSEQYRFTLAFKHANHEMHLTRTGMREGEFFAYGTIDFLGSPVAKSRLELGDKVMGVYYDGAAEVQRGPLTFTLALDYLGDSASGAGIPAEIEQIADAIVSSIAFVAEP